MPELVSDLIVSLDMLARGERSPGFYGYLGPEFEAWLDASAARPHRQIIGRKTYEMLNALPEEARDEGWRAMAATPGWLVSRSLRAADWPGLEVVGDDLLGLVRGLKGDDGPELRTVGSPSLVRQLHEAGLLDRIRLMVCPLVLPRTGAEPAFEGWPDAAFELLSTQVLDGRVLLLEYRPAGAPPRGDQG